MLSELDKQLFLRLFNRNGYVLDFSTRNFDDFTNKSVGIPVCAHYGLSKGASLESYIAETDDEHAQKLLFDLFNYYEALFGPEYDLGQVNSFNPSIHQQGMGNLYLKCLEIRNRELASGKEAEPHSVASNTASGKNTASSLEMSGPCMVFISHASENRLLASELKRELTNYGINSTVAHDDIAVSADWYLELERMLSCCHALAYLSTQYANQSSWCQQEIGWALGRGIPTVSIIVDKETASFLGRKQALRLNNSGMASIAQHIFNCFMNEWQMPGPVIDGLLDMLNESNSYDDSNSIVNKILKAPGITRLQAQQIEQIIIGNDQVRNANWGKLPDTLRSLRILD